MSDSPLLDAAARPMNNAAVAAERIRIRAMVETARQSDSKLALAVLEEADVKAAVMVIEAVIAEHVRAGLPSLELPALIDHQVERMANAYIMTRSSTRLLRFACYRLRQLPDPKLEESGQTGENRDSRVKSPRRAIRRTSKYVELDNALRSIDEMHPSSQEEIFRTLDSRNVRVPRAEPFRSAGGWMAGFKKDKHGARAWLSKAWTRLELTPIARGPKAVTVTAGKQ